MPKSEYQSFYEHAQAYFAFVRMTPNTLPSVLVKARDPHPIHCFVHRKVPLPTSWHLFDPQAIRSTQILMLKRFPSNPLVAHRSSGPSMSNFARQTRRRPIRISCLFKKICFTDKMSFASATSRARTVIAQERTRRILLLTRTSFRFEALCILLV